MNPLSTLITPHPPPRKQHYQGTTSPAAALPSSPSSSPAAAAASPASATAEEQESLRRRFVNIKNDPRPFVLGLPKTTEYTRRKLRYAADLSELHSRQQRASLVGLEMDHRNDIITEWAAAACAMIHHDQQQQQQQQQQRKGQEEEEEEKEKEQEEQLPVFPGPSSCKYFLVVAEELYCRQVASLQRDTELEEIREWRRIVFDYRREIFVFSHPIRRAIKKFVQLWVATRRAKLLLAGLRRQDLCRREANERRDHELEHAEVTFNIMSSITVQLAEATKERLIAFMLSLQRGVWIAKLCFEEKEARRQILWGRYAPVAPLNLLEATGALPSFSSPSTSSSSSSTSSSSSSPSSSSSSSTPSSSSSSSQASPALASAFTTTVATPTSSPSAPPRGLLVSLTCAEYSSRHVIKEIQRTERIDLIHFLQRSRIEEFCSFEKRHLTESDQEFRTSVLFPRARGNLDYCARRDLEETEFEAREAYSLELLVECEKDISKTILETRNRAQKKIATHWLRHTGKQMRRRREAQVMREVMRQERQEEIKQTQAAMRTLFVETESPRIENYIEQQQRRIIEATWERSMLFAFTTIHASRHEVFCRNLLFPQNPELVRIGQTLSKRHHLNIAALSVLFSEYEQGRLDIVQEQDGESKDMSSALFLHHRFSSRINNIVQDVKKLTEEYAEDIQELDRQKQKEQEEKQEQQQQQQQQQKEEEDSTGEKKKVSFSSGANENEKKNEMEEETKQDEQDVLNDNSKKKEVPEKEEPEREDLKKAQEEQEREETQGEQKKQEEVVQEEVEQKVEINKEDEVKKQAEEIKKEEEVKSEQEVKEQHQQQVQQEVQKEEKEEVQKKQKLQEVEQKPNEQEEEVKKKEEDVVETKKQVEQQQKEQEVKDEDGEHEEVEEYEEYEEEVEEEAEEEEQEEESKKKQEKQQQQQQAPSTTEADDFLDEL